MVLGGFRSFHVLVTTGRKDRVDLALIYRHVVIFIARFG